MEHPAMFKDLVAIKRRLSESFKGSLDKTLCNDDVIDIICRVKNEVDKVMEEYFKNILKDLSNVPIPDYDLLISSYNGESVLVQVSICGWNYNCDAKVWDIFARKGVKFCIDVLKDDVVVEGYDA